MLIFLDIDGTLTEPGKNVPPVSAQRAIREARACGNRVLLCTGRNYDMLSPLLQYGFDGVIASSGGYIRCGDELVYDHPFREDQKRRVMEVLEKYGIYRTVECVDGSYTDDGFKEFLWKNAKASGNSEVLRWREQIEQDLNIRSMAEYDGQSVYKVVFMSPTKEQLIEPRRILGEEFSICIQEDGGQGFVNGELIGREYDKGQALRRICEYFQVPLADTIAFGDSMNDLEMLQTAGHGICMANGSEALKAVADEVCPSVTEDGIYRAFLKHGLLESAVGRSV